MSNNPKELSQEDVEDEWQAVVHSVQVGAEPVENPAQRSRVEESNLWANSIKFIKLLGDRFARKNSRQHNSIYNVLLVTVTIQFVQSLTQLLPSNLEVHFTCTLS